MVIRSRKLIEAFVIVFALGALVSVAEAVFNGVVPGVFDPDGTFQVVGDWIQGLGSPDCSTVSDTKVRGLLLAKSAQTPVNASGGATLKGVNGTVLPAGDALGWDIRSGSACGAGAPRFNVTTQDGNAYFIGCSSPGPKRCRSRPPRCPPGGPACGSIPRWRSTQATRSCRTARCRAKWSRRSRSSSTRGRTRPDVQRDGGARQHLRQRNNHRKVGSAAVQR